MSRLSCKITKNGLLNLPGTTHASKTTVEELLLQDAETYHCFFNPAGLHNHLSHHLLAAYDLGSSASHIKKIYDDEMKMQRPRIVGERDKSIIIHEDNWIQYLGNSSAYNAFVTFFSDSIKSLGVVGTLEKYVFDKGANVHGVLMLNRVMSGVVHPLILLGYGTEFRNDMLIATGLYLFDFSVSVQGFTKYVINTGLAQAALHSPTAGPSLEGTSSTQAITLLELIREVYDSEALKPALPYDPKATINARIKTVLANGGEKEIQKICTRYYVSNTVNDEEVAKSTEEFIWAATLLTFGTGKRDRKPRLDFFLMHLLTSSLFLRPFCAILKKREHKAALLRAYVSAFVLTLLTRGRPRIDAELLMSYSDVPRPPLFKKAFPPTFDSSSLGKPTDDADYNPWPAMIEGAQYHSDAHVLKAMRTLVYGAQHFGTTPPGEVIGAFSAQTPNEGETHVGMSKLDGTVFVRAAGMLMGTVGWVSYGQKAGGWDTSALGWDKAWEKEGRSIN